MNQPTMIALVGVFLMVWGAKDVIVLANLDVWTFLVGIGVLGYAGYSWLTDTPETEPDAAAAADE